MKSKAVAHLLADVGVTKSHSRPHVSNDNPSSESQFKTLKYCPEFPERFGCIQDSRAFGHRFFTWYNEEHRHSGIALMTPEQVHYGKAEEITALRAQVLAAAFESNPVRFKGRAPKPFPLPEAAWKNKPSTENIGVQLPEFGVSFPLTYIPLVLFDIRVSAARRMYRNFVKQGIEKGNRPELSEEDCCGVRGDGPASKHSGNRESTRKETSGS